LDYPRAVDDFTAALKIDSSFIPANAGLAWTQWLRGDLPGAISHLKEALQKDYDNRKIWSQIETFLEETDDRAGVVKLYREPYEKYKSDLERATASNRAEIEDQLAWVEMNYAGALSRAELWNELLSVSQAGFRRSYTGSSHSDELDHANTWRLFRGFAENHLHMQQEAITDFEAILDSLNDDPHYPPIAVSHVCEELYLAYLWIGNQTAADRVNQNCESLEKRLAAAIPTPSSDH
jgi:tetratricopeptide (TPR) repeat protein